MKRLNSIKLLALLFVGSFAFSCSDDDGGTLIINPPSSTTVLYASNNANGNITSYDLTDPSDITTTTLTTLSTAADGIYYDASSDAVVQASRSNNNLEGYTDISTQEDGTAIEVDIVGSADMTSPREVAVNGNLYVVADNSDADGDLNTPDGRLFIYTKDGDAFSLRNVITTDFKLWGITFIGADLYAVVDATNELAVFTNFLSNTDDTELSASKSIAIDGILRTHGLTYDADLNTMIMTDIGDAGNGQDDGAFHVIPNFTTNFNNTADGETLALSEQIRVSGANTLLGNPVDVAFDSTTGTVFIAEAGNDGGRILAFSNISTGGNLTPSVNNSLPSASSVYLSKQ